MNSVDAARTLLSALSGSSVNVSPLKSRVSALFPAHSAGDPIAAMIWHAVCDH
jgi:hypothetical protein